VELLKVENLAIGENTQNGKILVEDVSFNLKKGETIGVVGESGSGKTVTSMSIPNLLPGDLKIARGNIFFEGKDLVNFSERELENIRGLEIGIIFQNPISSLNPLMRVGKQIKEVITIHRKISDKEATKLVEEALLDVGFNNPAEIAKRYPHELSGGQGQRIGIAMAIANRPKLIIADESTTALDVRLQVQVLKILKQIQIKYNTAIIFISHDLGIIRKVADKIIVMYHGQIIEKGSAEKILNSPRHPYTYGLIKSLPGNFKRGEKIQSMEGTIPGKKEKIEGCFFYKRCFKKTEDCCVRKITLNKIGKNHYVRCIHPLGEKYERNS
jgi:oligopeptide/dipeptide ABC transporter ATP-binding protein